jgi:FlaA1/EpsC-like NDP-sugar epimerase
VRALSTLPILIVVHATAYWLRFESEFWQQEPSRFLATLSVVVTIKTAVYLKYRVYHGCTRYVSFQDLMVLTKATTLAAGLIAIVDYLFLPGLTVPRSVFLFDWAITIIAVGGLRSFARMIAERDTLLSLHGGVPVFIVGANDSGETLLRAIRRDSSLGYRVVGFIAEKEESLQGYIAGVPVLGMLENTCELALNYNVNEVLITAGELPGQQVRTLVNDGKQSGVTVKVLPSYEQILHGKVDLRPRTVSIEDLLRREPVQLHVRELHHWLDDRVLLVTGSAGSIGSEICRQLLQFSPEKLVLVDQSETGQFFLERELRSLAPELDIQVCIGDVCDSARMQRLFLRHKPEIVFHAAAYKHVPLMESNPEEAIKNITLASRLLADLSNQCNVQSFVMISTDKAVNPTSVMGTCKRVAELYVQALAAVSDCRFVTVRFGNVLDSAGSVVPVFREQIGRGGPVTVTHPDMLRYFMTIPEASQLVIQAGAMGQGGEIFVLDMGEPVRIVNLAEDLIRLSGLRVGDDIEIVFNGTRPGEKLFEELHADGEAHKSTSHPKIMVAASAPSELREIRSRVDEINALVGSDISEIIASLKVIVPEFGSSKPATVRLRSAA